jgi:shikimate dehydrogenase
VSWVPSQIYDNVPVTDRYAVIGNPIRHSKSPEIHRSFARNTGEDLEYTIIESPRDGFQAAVNAFREAGGRGLNVTAPFKLEAFRLADQRSERAEIAGSVNTLRFEGATALADNFDGVGLVRDIRANLRFGIEGRRALVLGAGGAARGILQALMEEHPSELVIANRSVARALEVGGLLGGGAVRGGGYDEIGDGGFDLVINATSASMEGDLPPLTAAAFASGAIAYELAYGLGMTPFLDLARTAGAAHVVDGVGMLVEQAAEAFAWWRGVRPDTRAMIEALTVPLV